VPTVTAEFNGFICDEANKALQAMISGVSESRATSALVACSAHRNPSCRAKAALHLSRAFEQMGYARVLQSREIERIVPILVAFLSEGLSETRAASKHMVSALMREAAKTLADAERMERLLCRHLTEPAYRKLRDSAGSSDCALVTGGHGMMNGASSAVVARTQRRGSEGRGSLAGSSRDEGDSNVLKTLPSTLSWLGSSDWAERMRGLVALQELVEQHGGLLVARGKMLSIFDHLTPRLTDQNSKVNVAALQALHQMVPQLREGLPSVVATVVPALAASLASGNAQVRGCIPVLLDTLLAQLDHAALISPLANCALYGNLKARPAMVDRLRVVSNHLYATKPQLVAKHAVPAAFHLLEENRPDTRVGTVLLLRTLHAVMGKTLLEHAIRTSLVTQQRLQEVLLPP